ncbi:MAG: hypothetical protein WAO31_03255 [Rhodoluna sp.]
MVAQVIGVPILHVIRGEVGNVELSRAARQVRRRALALAFGHQASLLRVFPKLVGKASKPPMARIGDGIS